MNICVFCSSSNHIDGFYFEEARSLGKFIVAGDHSLVYGGTNLGLMGALAQTVKEQSGKVTGVIPRFMQQKGIAYREVDELIITKSLRERKAVMEQVSDVFIGLPGGFGTLEELLEVITLKQVQHHQKPIVLINTRGFFNSLRSFFDHLFMQKFSNERFRSLFFFADNAAQAFEYIRNYNPGPAYSKWA